MNAVKQNIRQPVWAGQFYPGNAQTLRQEVQTYLANAKPAGGFRPKAVIAPHAGYVYSGPVAGSAFAAFDPDANAVRRVVLLGPSHHVAFSGLALSSREAFATPLGVTPLDLTAAEAISALPQVHVMDRAHEQEHSLEVELPFLQEVFKGFSLVPLTVGEAENEEIAEVLIRLWGGPETRIVISSDLSHYLDYEAAQQRDRATAQAIEALRPEDIADDQACGRRPIRGLLHVARQYQMRVKTVDLRNSGDTAGRRDRVVGYGAFLLSNNP